MIRLTSLACLIALSVLSATASADRITCKSHDYEHNHCGMDTRGGVELVEQRSDAECRQGRSWGIDNDGVWVDDGCEAVFETSGGRHDNRGHKHRAHSDDSRPRETYRDECENTIAGNQCGR